MPLLIISALLGFIAGKFFTPNVLIIMTLICVIIGIYLEIAAEEVEEKITTMIFTGCAVIFCGVVWVTYYLSENKTWLGDLLNTYIFR